MLVQPSFEEGFGFPVLEAMTLGVPVVAANRGSLPELLGGAGTLVEPDDPDQMAAAIERVMLDDEAFAAECAAKGACEAPVQLEPHRATFTTYRRAADRPSAATVRHR